MKPMKNLKLPKKKIVEFCKKHGVQKLSLFGSALRGDFRPESDIDILVVFYPEKRVGLIGLSAMEFELSEIIGQKVDLNTPGFLNKHYRDQVLLEAEVQYDAA